MAGRWQRRPQRGVALLIFMVLLVMGALSYMVTSFSPDVVEAMRRKKTEAALAEARDALLGYALKYRDDQIQDGNLDRVYGYLPLPDLGHYPADWTDRNNNTNCRAEGCNASNFSGNATYTTVIGRLPWKALGLPPLRDGHGECLWYAVSGSHQNALRASPNNAWAAPPMNWDTLGHFDIVAATGSSSLASVLASAHERPVAVIFSPGPPLPGQNRDQDAKYDVALCGGNYNAVNYLDPHSATALGNVTNYLAGTNAASSVTGDTDLTNDPDTALKKSLLVQGKTYKTGTNYHTSGCPDSGCTLLGNDVGLPLASDVLFGAIRKNTSFRNDINTMLDRMVSCLRDDLAAGTAFKPLALPSPPDASLPTDPATAPYKAAGRIYSHTCYDDTASTVNTVNPKGYYAHYKDQLFVAACPGTLHTVNGAACGGALIFAGERDTTTAPPKYRSSQTERNTPANYLESPNIASFGTLQNLDYSSCTTGQTFTGDTLFKTLASGQTRHQDIVRCIPGSASFNVVAPAVATSAMGGTAVELADYAPATRTLTLGSGATHSNYGASAANLFACAWTPETHGGGSGFRSYFRFRIRLVGEGFTYAVIDGDRNDASVCGAAFQHLGYSGDNGVTPRIEWPKLAIEFDTVRNTVSGDPKYAESGTPKDSVGRNDPCYQSSCGSTQNLNSNAHVAVVYWGYAASNASNPAVTQTLKDDNVHGFPWPSNFSWPMTSTWPPTAPTPEPAANRPPPHNPDATMPYNTSTPSDPPPGVVPVDGLGRAPSATNTAHAQREYHARIEVTRSFTTPADAKDGATGIQVKLWLERHGAANITAMTYNAGSPPTLSITAASHGFSNGDTVVIKDAVPTGYNGEYPVTVVNSNDFIATLPDGTADPGKYIRYISWVDSGTGTDQATVTSPGHGLLTGNTVTISGAIPAEYNGTRTVTRIDADRYRFGIELSYEPGDMPQAIAAHKSLSPQAIALANTTRPMSELYASFAPTITDSTTIYDEKMAACAGSAPLCPTGQSCGSDNFCYRPSFRNLRLGFTIGERVTASTSTAREQLIEIKDHATTWLE